MIKKPILWLLLFVSAAYFNSLFNGFVGDDDFVIVQNDFYRHDANWKRLFSKTYFTHPDEVFYGSNDDLGSGSVAYRPVAAVTYFLDYHLWQLNPFGYHLTNLILHMANTILLFLLVLSILLNTRPFLPENDGTTLSLGEKRPGGNEFVAFWTALLFGLHPIGSEVVCNIGYRADLLAFLFLGLSFLALIISERRRDRRQKILYQVGAHVAFFLAVFAKESAIIYPVLLVFYAEFVKKLRGKVLWQQLIRYSGFFVIMIFYLYVYVFVFPNVTLDQATWIGGKLSTHFLSICHIMADYMTAFILPWRIEILPIFYNLPVEPWWRSENLLAFSILGLWTGIFLRLKSWIPSTKFFIIWFLIALIPVSNIIPLINPVGYRFLYLPSAGLFAVLAFMLERVCIYVKSLFQNLNIAFMLKAVVVSACLILTVSLNDFWKNDYSVASQWILNYPNDPWGYFILGQDLFKRKNYRQAQVSFEKAITIDPGEVRTYYMLGLCYADAGEKKKAETILQKAITLRADFPGPYIALGKLYFFDKEYEKSLPYFEKGTVYDSDFAEPYQYWIMACAALKRLDQAETVLARARQNIPDPAETEKLQELFNYLKKKI